ncbi:unnamed protein product [Cunninghamella blakesleeana]
MPINPRVFFDIDIDGQRIGRVIFELFANEVPNTAENFRALCTGELGLGKISNMPLHYRGSIFHRVIKGFMIQGGDFTRRNGSGGESIYGQTFPDESFQRKHTVEGLLSMANRGPNTQSSQFFITTRPTPHLDGKHVVFGRVVHGYDIVQSIENEAVDERSKPLRTVMIANCGELQLKIPSKPQQEVLSEKETKNRKRSRSVSSQGSRSSVESKGTITSDEDSEEERRHKKRKKSSKKDKKKKKKKSKKHSKKSKRRRSDSVDSYDSYEYNRHHRSRSNSTSRRKRERSRSPEISRSRSVSRSKSPLVSRSRSPLKKNDSSPVIRSLSRSPSIEKIKKNRASLSKSPPPVDKKKSFDSSSRRDYRKRGRYHSDDDSNEYFDDRSENEKPDWERERRFVNDPDVKFKGRGRKKYTPNGGMRAW